MRHRRILAAAAVFFFVVCLAVMIVSAFSDSPQADNYLLASLFCLMVIPAVFYGYLILTKNIRDKHKPDQ